MDQDDRWERLITVAQVLTALLLALIGLIEAMIRFGTLLGWW